MPDTTADPRLMSAPRPPAKPVLDAAEAAALIPDGATITISASSGLNCPDAILKAIGERFARDGHPRGITSLNPIAAGDMYGIGGIDHLARPGLLARIIAGSYPSGPSSSAPPRIREMISDNAIAAYNVPSGILYDMHREAAAHRAGVMTQVGLDTFVDPRRQGCRMNDAAAEPIVSLTERDGRDYLLFRNFPPDVAILRATTADEHGNLTSEREGAPLGVMDLALATRANGGIVIAQVQRLAAAGSLPAQAVRVPGTLVDAIVLAPDQMQCTQVDYDPAISGEIQRPMSAFAPVPFGPDKVIARRAARELKRGWACNLGFGISAMVPEILIEEGAAGAVTWAIEQGPVGGVPLTGFAFGCAANAEAIIPSPAQFTYFQGGRFDCALLSFLEIDAAGCVNVSSLAARPHVTAGAGGFVDITAHGQKLVFSGFFAAGGIELAITDRGLDIRRDGKVCKLVGEVEHVSFSGRRAREQGQDVTYITERCVIRLIDGRPTVVEIAPGVNLRQDILDRAGFDLAVSDRLVEMDAALFDPAPLGLRLPEETPAIERFRARHVAAC